MSRYLRFVLVMSVAMALTAGAAAATYSRAPYPFAWFFALLPIELLAVVGVELWRRGGARPAMPEKRPEE